MISSPLGLIWRRPVWCRSLWNCPGWMGAVGLAATALAAAPGFAGCFTTTDLPKRAIYEGGSTLDYIAVEDEVLTYQSGEVVSRMASGLWPIDIKTPGFTVTYDWDGDLPDLAAIRDAGGSLSRNAMMKRGKGASGKVSLAVEILGQEDVVWEDCIYKAWRLRKVVTAADGKTISDGTMVFAPSAFIAFSTEAIDPADGSSSLFRLKALEQGEAP
ncbi:hypothetical protein HOY34_08700 [Xinfangfangia sp. D13-10-4-6]|uniref:hypothetical protein n=1 Tax=Pseudogemmobacter hezensis TaxID=2737662 RepID=UPI0015583459|nr:hypothetical protein [Pseudogemmobacter hezensis]NPD15276.1 hypothetical protein [Pseudogemmobacter hezensis]